MYDAIYLQKPFSFGHAWIDLILLANFADANEVDGFDLVMVKRGQVRQSLRWFADRWGWSKDKVEKYFDLLVKDGKITRENLKGKTALTIEKYSFFQGGADRGKTERRQTTDRQQTEARQSTDTAQTEVRHKTETFLCNKKNKNIKNVKKDKKENPLTPFREEAETEPDEDDGGMTPEEALAQWRKQNGTV